MSIPTNYDEALKQLGALRQENDNFKAYHRLLTRALVHEIRSAFGAMIGHLDLLNLEGLSPEVVETVTAVKGQGYRLSRIMETLHWTNQVDHPDFYLKAEAVDTRQLIEEAVQEIQIRYENHDFVMQMPQGLPPVFVDRARMMTALVFVLQNAVRFTPEDETILISVLPTASSSKQLIINIDYDGTELPPEFKADPFSVVTGSISNTSGQARAILRAGLYPAHEIACRAGGDLMLIESSPTHTTFQFKIPLAEML